MDLKHSIQRAAVVVGILALISITAVAQENRSEISIQGTGFFTNDTQGNGVQDHTTNTGGFLIGYRYNFNRWLAAEANYGYDRNTQVYFGSTPARVQSDIHQITGAAVVRLPGFARTQPYALAGGGALVFNPTGNVGNSLCGRLGANSGSLPLRCGCGLRSREALVAPLRISRLRVRSTQLQSRRFGHRQLDA
ncbi:MAG: hypothetical protein DMG82_08115 [Acidobacteria bacterium]|nr:MAG: hypothetical protein DMG82_08115 [Acidobacteriota bacterium]